MSATMLTPTRALRQPRTVDWRAVFGVFLTVFAMGGSIAFWTLSSDTRALVVASRDLPTGATLASTDLVIARVRVDDSIYQAAVPAADLGSLVGKPIVEPVYAHQILARAQVSPRPRLGPGQLALAIPITPESAAGGMLQPLDAVEVLLTTDKGKPEARTTVVLPRAIVNDVGYAGRLGAVNVDAGMGPGSQGPIRWLTLVVSQHQAVQLAHAKWAGELDVALLPPAQGSDNGGTGGTAPGR